MTKKKLDKLLQEGVLSQKEYNLFFQTMRENENGEMVGIVPHGSISYKYYLDGDMLNGDLREFLMHRVCPPYQAEEYDDVFKKYGMMVTGVADYWHWFTRENISERALANGYRPIEEASELELWMMIAICERHWEVFYEELCDDLRSRKK